jgi:hypothetical protein
LTVTSILFGFLAGFFITELWTRYSTIRTLQAEWSANLISFIRYSKLFYHNKKFKESFTYHMKRYLVCPMTISWQKLEYEIKYFSKLSSSLEILKNEKTSLLQNINNKYDDCLRGICSSEMLTKEKLFVSEWIIIFLSAVILVSSIFLKTENLIINIISYAFPLVIVAVLILISELNNLEWSKRNVTFEPIARCYDFLGIKRFYPTFTLDYKPKELKSYITEKDLDKEMKDVFDEITKSKSVYLD